jgi:hypothetical protein
MKVPVVELVGPVCVAPSDGARLYERLSGLLQSGELVELDFSGVTTLTSSFLNPAVGKLYGTFADLESRMTFTGLDAGDSAVLRLVQSNAKRFYASDSERQQRLKDALQTVV